MEEKTGIVLLAVLMCASIVLSVIFNMSILNVKTDKVDLTGINSDIASVKSTVDGIRSDLNRVEVVEEEVEVEEIAGDFMLNKAEFEDEAVEAKALELATESIGSRDFKKAVFETLEDFGVDIDSYKDITEIRVLESDVDGDEVEFDIKVYYFIDGDEDETERARFDEFEVTIDDLEFDDDFEDAEVDDSYMDLLVVNKVYD